MCHNQQTKKRASESPIRRPSVRGAYESPDPKIVRSAYQKRNKSMAYSAEGDQGALWVRSRNPSTSCFGQGPSPERQGTSPAALRRATAGRKNVRSTVIDESLQFFLLGHVHKMDYLQSLEKKQKLQERKHSHNCVITLVPPNAPRMHPSHKKSGTLSKSFALSDAETAKTQGQLMASESPRDLALLAAQVRSEAAHGAQSGMRDSFGLLQGGKHHLVREVTGTIYKGELQGETKHGVGIAVFSDGRIYKGYWRNGLPGGSGLYKTNFGFTIAAQFDADLNVVSSEAKFYVPTIPPHR